MKALAFYTSWRLMREQLYLCWKICGVYMYGRIIQETLHLLMLDRQCHQACFRNSRTWRKGLGFHIIYFSQFWVLTHLPFTSWHCIPLCYKSDYSLFKMIKINSTNHTRTHGDLRGPTSFEHHRETQVICCAKTYSSAPFVIAQNKLMMFIIIRIRCVY